MASNALITITYSVSENKRSEFESIIRPLVATINGAQGSVRLSVFQEEDEPGSIVEVYECDSTEAYDALEDSLDDATQQSIQRIATEFAVARQSVMTLRRLV